MKNLFTIALLASLIFSSCTKDGGSILLSFNKKTAVYGDIEEIRNTPLLEAAKTISNPGKVYIGEEILLIGEEGSGIHIYDNSNPTNPQNMAYLNVPFCREFFVSENKIFAESQYDMLKIDISNPSAPFIESRVTNAFGATIQDNQGRTVIGFTAEEVTENIKLNSAEHNSIQETHEILLDFENSLIPASAVPSSFAGSGSGLSGTINRITEHNNTVYVASATSIHVFSNSGDLQKVNEISTRDFTETLYPKGDHLFAGGRNSMKVFDLSSPENPVEESSFWHTTSCDPVLPHPEEDIAFITIRTGDFSNCPGDVNLLEIVSLENINNPTRIQSIELQSPYGMALVENVLYVGNGTNGLVKFDVSDPANAFIIETDDSIQAYDVIPHPTIPNLILTAGPEGINQYEYNAQTLEFTLIGQIHIPA